MTAILFVFVNCTFLYKSFHKEESSDIYLLREKKN